MASLKDINATIEEGNEDLEKLNQNFTKWFESQKKSGDDLEAAKEARMKRDKGSGGIVKAAATGAVVSKAMDFPLNKMLIGAGLLGLGGALLAAFRKELADFFSRLLPNIPSDRGQDFANEIGFGAKATSNAVRRFNARQSILNAEAAERRRLRNRIQPGYDIEERQRRLNQRQAFLASEPNARRPRSSSGMGTQPGARIGSFGDDIDDVNKNRINRGTASRYNTGKRNIQFDPNRNRFVNINTGQIVSNKAGMDAYREMQRLKELNATVKNKGNVDFKRSKFGNAFRSTTSLVSTANSKLGEAFRKYNERVGGGTRTGLPNPNTWRGTTVAFGDAVINFFKRIPIVGTFGRFLMKTLLHPTVLRIVGSKLIIIELLALWHNRAIDYTSMLPGGEPVLREVNYTEAEKITGTIMLLGAVYTSVIGATIGGIIGTMTLGGLGTISGGLLGMYLGFQAPGKLMQVLKAFAERNNIYDKELASFRDRRKAQQKANANEFAQANLGTNAGANATVLGRQNFERGFVGGALLSSQGAGDGLGLSATLPSNSSQNMMAGNRMFGAISAKAITGADRAAYLASGNQRNLGVIKRSFNSILGGVSTLSGMMFGQAEAGTLGFSTPVVNSSLGSITANQFGNMNGPPGTGTTANAVVNSGNTNTNVTTILSGGNGLNTVDNSVSARSKAYYFIGSAASGMGGVY